MKGKNNQEETYFLGKAQETRYTKSHLYKKVFGIAACVIAIIGIALILMFKPQSVSQPHVLKTIAVLPEGGQMPVFNGNGDINDFCLHCTSFISNCNIINLLERLPTTVPYINTISTFLIKSRIIIYMHRNTTSKIINQISFCSSSYWGLNRKQSMLY